MSAWVRGLAVTVPVHDRFLYSVEVLDTSSGTWTTLQPGALLPIDVPSQPNEVLCEFKEQPCARYM